MTVLHPNPELAICIRINKPNGLKTPYSGETGAALRNVRGISQIATAQPPPFHS